MELGGLFHRLLAVVNRDNDGSQRDSTDGEAVLHLRTMYMRMRWEKISSLRQVEQQNVGRRSITVHRHPEWGIENANPQRTVVHYI